jgi:transcription-repair coupling factor (superfamily II helicase)
MDRFGKVPEPVDNLLYLVRLKTVAQKAKLASISASDGQIILMLRPTARLNPSLVSHMIDAPITVKSNQIWVKHSALGKEWRERLYNLVDDLVA